MVRAFSRVLARLAIWAGKWTQARNASRDERGIDVKNKYFTILIVPDGSPSTRKLRVPQWVITRAVLLLGVLLLVVLGASVHYFQVVGEVTENKILRDENVQLRNDLKKIREKVTHVSATLDRVERFDQKLRSITLLSDPDRHLAIGPVGVMDSEDRDSPSARAMLGDVEEPNQLTGKLDSLSAEAARQEASLQELQAYFEDQKSLLSSTPSVWPVRGWVTSDFGHRLDPFTAERIMHKGLDISTAFGTAVVAPSDGTVIFAGMEGGYGKVVVLDHGFGVKSRYGHLSDINCKVGDRIKRGDKIAAVGNTGRSTGPHLHYEVRVNGVPENPRKFILE
jgi:murein DD-endopeptidase MepM/ murein hydrolase activator NlpD